VPVAPDDPATPGRRHPGDGVLGQLVGSVSGRFERPQLVVVAAIVALGLLLAGWAVLRARPVAIASPAAAGSAESGAPASGPAAPTTTASPPAPSGPSVTATAAGQATASTAVAPGGGSPSATIEVHVLGAVRRPGVVALPAGARVNDAVREAGGLKTSAHLGALNLAQPLGDGQQVYIARGGHTSEVRDPTAPVVAPPAGGSTDGGVGAGGGPASAPPQGPVNLNSASLEQLDQLPGIGPVTAQKILDWRQQNGRFSAVEELQEVDGIGPKTFADLQPLVTV
jgi:competence protein ComEA